MGFSVKMDDKKIKVDLEWTNLKDILIYCKPKERLILMKKYGLDGSKELALQKIGKEYSLTRERVRQIETQALMAYHWKWTLHQCSRGMQENPWGAWGNTGWRYAYCKGNQ